MSTTTNTVRSLAEELRERAMRITNGYADREDIITALLLNRAAAFIEQIITTDLEVSA